MKNLMQAHNQWATRTRDERFETLDEMLEAITARQERTQLAQAELSKIHFSADDKSLYLDFGGAPYGLTNWAFGQVCSLAQMPSDFLGQLSAPVAAAAMNDRLSKIGFQQSKIGKRTNGSRALLYNDKQVRAVVSSAYQILWDAEVVKWVQNFTKGGTWRRPKALDEATCGPAGLYASDRDLFIFLVEKGKTLDDDSDQGLGSGIFCWNSEVANNRQFGFMSFGFRYICGNHIVWDAENVVEFQVRHFGQNFREAAQEAFGAFFKTLDKSNSEHQKAIKEARKKVVAKTPDAIKDTLSGFGIKRQFSGQVLDFLKGKDQEPTVWNVVNGITWLSQTSQYADARNSLDMAAGRLLAAATA